MKRSAWMPYFLLTLTVLFWSGNFVLGRGIRELIPPVSLNFWRWVGAIMILLPFGVPRIINQKALFHRHWKMVALLSIPSIAFFNTFIYTALQTTSATNTVLVNAMIPIFIAIFSWPILGDHLGSRQVVGVITSLMGLLFIVSKGDLSIFMALSLSKGDLWTLAATMSWAAYSVILRKRPKQMDAIAFLTLLVAFGLLFSLPWYIWEFSCKGGFSLSWITFGSLVYVALFPSVLSFIFWNNGIEKVGANRTGIFIHLMPVFSIVMAILFLREQPHLFHLIGISLIFFGIALTTIRPADQ